jgi:hypothetical protein
MSLPYKFNTETFQNIPNGIPMSTAQTSYQYSSQQAATSIFVYKSTIDAFYKAQNPNTPSSYQFKSHQERLAALIGRLNAQCPR